MDRQTLKRYIPPAAWRAASEARYAFNRAALWPAATFHPWRRASRERLAALKDIHRGQRCFIIGNGPSLKQTDLSRLRDENTFGMNRFYMAFPELGFTTTYFLSVNSLVIEQCAADFRSLPIPKFLSWRSRHLVKPAADHIFLHTTYSGPRFATDAGGRLWEGATVTYVALQLAYHMGFRQAILIGVDHSFTTQGTPNTTVVSQGDDPNHFHPGYFGKGFRWQLPDLETSERAYRMANDAYREMVARCWMPLWAVRLEVFPKVDYNSLFDRSAEVKQAGDQ